jgi:hypothetical protein
MGALEWAIGAKSEFVKLQKATGVPAWGAAAHHCHEAWNVDGTMSSLAAKYNNHTGMKAAKWQKEFGCGTVDLPTWEVIDGRDVKVTATFCTCPDFATWLKVYALLLTGKTYGGALAYRHDPYLYIKQVWKSGWATDPAYMDGIERWMKVLAPYYADTVEPAASTAKYPPIKVALPTGRTIYGELRDGVTFVETVAGWVPLRACAELLGAKVEWLDADRGVVVSLPQTCKCCEGEK